MTLLHAVIFGVVEGITEFLPISSTAHLILTARLLGLTQSEFQKTFEIAIQLGAILSVIVFYWRSLLNKAILMRLIVAFIPTAIVGLVLHKVIKNILFESESVILWSLFIGGIFLTLFELTHDEKRATIHDIEKIPYAKAAYVGLFQALAVIPGVSRSAATIVGGLLLGVNRPTIVSFSFLLAVPTMLAATVLDMGSSAHSFTVSEWGMLSIGFIVSFIVALGSIVWLLSFIRRHTFVPFGIYRVMIACVFWLTGW